MKKVISFILCVLMLTALFGTQAFAESKKITYKVYDYTEAIAAATDNSELRFSFGQNFTSQIDAITGATQLKWPVPGKDFTSQINAITGATELKWPLPGKDFTSQIATITGATELAWDLPGKDFTSQIAEITGATELAWDAPGNDYSDAIAVVTGSSPVFEAEVIEFVPAS